MKLLEAHLAPYVLPFLTPFQAAGAQWSERRGWILKLQAAGHLGFGECAPLPGFSAENLAHAERDLRRLVRALALTPLPGTCQEVADWMLHQDAAPSAKMAVEVALLDLLARQSGQPLHAFLRPGSQPRVEVNATLGGGGDRVAQALALKQQGYRCLKVKVGLGEVEEEVRLVATLRHALGPQVELRLDANGAWSPLQAARALGELARYGVSFVEQPVADLIGFRAPCDIRIAADESLRTLADATAHTPWIDVAVIKPMLVGGLLPALEIEQALGAQGISTVYTTLLDGAIARAAVGHLASASTHLEGACGLATGALFVSDLSTSALVPQEGALHLPALPGLGVVPDQVEAYETLWSATTTWLPHPLAHRARYLPEQIAMSGPEGLERTWNQLYREGCWAAKRIQEKLGEAPLRVAIYAHNQPESVAWVHGVGLAGGHLVAIHPKTPWPAACLQITESGAQLVLSQRALWQGGKGGEEVGLPVLWIDEILLEQAAEIPTHHYPEVAEHDLAALLYTSGTTGSPKQVPLRWGQVARGVTGSAIALGHEAHDAWLLCLPLCHVGGLSVLWRCAWLGTRVHVLGGFDPQAVAALLVGGAVTQWSAVSAMMSQVLEALGGRQVHRAFRLALLGGGPVPARLIARCEAHGIKVAVTYGMTEGASQLTTAAPGTSGGEAGWPLVWNWVEVSKEGGVRVRGGTLMSGYVGEPGGEAWFETGDVAAWGPRGLQVIDRRTDLIVTGGENVYPAQVEAAIREHPEVQEVCVVGVGSEEWGQSVVAVLEGVALAALVPEIQAFVGQTLASFQVPRHWVVQERLARSSLGKVSRRRVKESLGEQVHQAIVAGNKLQVDVAMKESKA